MSLAGDPTQPSQAATKRYADKVLSFEAVYSDEGYVGMCSYDFTQLPAGVQVIAHCHGMHTPNDGGGGEFFWIPTSTDNHDGFTTYNPSSNVNYASPGRWKRRIDPNHICPEMAGAYGDGVHDDWVPLQVALDVGCQLFGQVCIRLTQGKSYFLNYAPGRLVGGVNLQYANAGALLVPNHCVIEGFGGALGLTGRAGFENAPQLLLHPQMTVVLAWFAEIRDCQVLRANMNGPVDHFAATGPSSLADEQAQVALWLSEDGTNPNINVGVRSIGITNYGHDTKISRVLVMGFNTAYYSNGYGRGTVDELYFDTAGKGIEVTESGDDALVHRCYSNGFWSASIAGQSNAAGTAGVRPGIAFDFHDRCDGLRCVDCSAVTWATQFHLKNVWSVTLVNPNGEPGGQAIGTVTRGIWTEQCVSHTVIINPLIDGNTYKCDFQHVPFSQATPTGANGTTGPGQYGTTSVAVIGGSIQGNPGTDSTNMVGIRLGSGSSGSITNVNFAGFPSGNPAISVQPKVGIWKISGCIPSFGVAWPLVSFQAVGNQLALDQVNVQQFGNDPIDGTQPSQITVSAPIIADGGLVVTSTGGTAPRDVRDRFAETFSVKDFGAVLDGNTDDTAAFLAAYQSVPAGTVIRVPPGIANIKDWSQRPSLNALETE